jgi:hypothetical protein
VQAPEQASELLLDLELSASTTHPNVLRHLIQRIAQQLHLDAAASGPQPHMLCWEQLRSTTTQ